MQFLKNLLKKILPPPVRTFLREINGLRDLISGQGKSLVSRLEQQAEGIAKLQFQLQRIQEQNELQLQNQNRIVEELAFQHKYLLKLAEDSAAHGTQLTALADAMVVHDAQTKELTVTHDAAMKELAVSFDAQLEERQKTARQELAAAIEKLGQLHGKQDALSVLVEKQGENLAEKILHTQETMKTESNALKRVIPDKPVFWTNTFERDIVRANWGNVTAEPDFAEKYLKLIAGMDEESVRKILRILIRQKRYLNTNLNEMNLFTRQEQEEIRLMKEHLNEEVLKLDDNLFTYRKYLLPINHFEASVFYYKHGIHELEHRDRVKGKVILDVGGYIGDSVLVLSELEPSEIHTFECVPENFELLKKTMELNRLTNVTPVNLALGAEPGTMTIHMAGSGSTSIDRPGLNYKGDVEIPVTTLDAYVAEHPMEIGLIKIDIEGGEPGFLAGAKQTICTQRPTLLLSIYHNAHDFFELKPLIESWNLGYRFKIHKPIFESTSGETLLLAEVDD